jgi:transposase
LKKLCRWLEEKLGIKVCRNTARKILRRARLSWKKCRKLLGKANPGKREAYLKQFAEIYERMRDEEVVVIYIDESHFHRDLDLGYTWSPIGQRDWRVSNCPGLSERINWFGAYNFSSGQCLIWNEGRCNGQSTATFLERVKEWVGQTASRIVIIWDGAPWHRARTVQEQAKSLGLEVIQLPGYSPDLNPIEGLWKWMREEVLQHTCHATLRDLFDACKSFVETINKAPESIITRLWPRFELDPDVEKLRTSI